MSIKQSTKVQADSQATRQYKYHKKKWAMYRGLAWQRWKLLEKLFTGKLSLRARGVLLYFRQRFTKVTKCRVSVAEISDHVHTSVRTLQRAFAELESSRILRIIRRFEDHSTYQLIYGNDLPDDIILKVFDRVSKQKRDTDSKPVKKRTHTAKEKAEYKRARAYDDFVDHTASTGNGSTEKLDTKIVLNQIKCMIQDLQDHPGELTEAVRDVTLSKLMDHKVAVEDRLQTIHEYEASVDSGVSAAGVAFVEWLAETDISTAEDQQAQIQQSTPKQDGIEAETPHWGGDSFDRLRTVTVVTEVSPLVQPSLDKLNLSSPKCSETLRSRGSSASVEVLLPQSRTAVSVLDHVSNPGMIYRAANAALRDEVTIGRTSRPQPASSRCSSFRNEYHLENQIDVPRRRLRSVPPEKSSIISPEQNSVPLSSDVSGNRSGNVDRPFCSGCGRYFKDHVPHDLSCSGCRTDKETREDQLRSHHQGFSS